MASWSRKFEEPIVIPPCGPRGKSRELFTLKDAGEYFTKLPKAEHSVVEWQTAMEALLLAVRGAPTMLARIGIMKALHRHDLREFKPSEKKRIGESESSLVTVEAKFRKAMLVAHRTTTYVGRGPTAGGGAGE